jgi:hypothetical protein
LRTTRPARPRRKRRGRPERPAGGDAARFAQALLTIAGQDQPPRRFVAGADAIGTAQQKLADLQADIESNRQLSTSLDFDAQLPSLGQS